MRMFSTFTGSAICAALVYGVWPEMWKSYGIMGGWLAGALLISISWYMNHWIGIIHNPEEKLWVDQGWAVGIGGIVWALTRFQGGFPAFKQCLPTLICCLIGGALAGLAASVIKKKHLSFTAPKEKEEV